MIGYLSLMDEAPDMPADQRARYIQITLDKAYRLETMVNEFFEITRFHAQRETIQKSRIDLCYMLYQLADELTPLLSKNGNTVSIDADEALTAYGDPEGLARAFGNILKNAAAYSDEHTEIRIAARAAKEFTVVTFQNRGPTIPPDRLPMLFERFYRADAARGSGGGGFGLGLTIAKEIVEGHGGIVTAASAEHTVTFTVRLPGEAS